MGKKKRNNRNVRKNAAGSIALCMIVKNEEANLARCLESVRGLVSEINIVDTGSSDNTIRLAESLGAKMRREQWVNDYSRARNASIEMARAEWILVLDADEVLSPDAIHKIEAAVRRPGIDGYVLPTRNYMNDPSVANFVANDGGYEPARAFKGWVESRKVRLFKRRNGIRFEGEIHEVIGPSIRRSGGRTEFLDAAVHHFGFLAPADTLKEKAARMLALAEAKCESQNRNYQAHYELGVILAQLGSLEKAENSFRKAIALRDDFALAHYDLAVVLARASRFDDAISEYRTTLKLDPQNADALCNLAVCFQKLGRSKEAEETYRLLLEKHPHEKRGWNNLGALLASMGKLAEAEQSFENAVQIDPDFSLSLQNLKSIRTLKTQSGAFATKRQQSNPPECHSRESGNPFDNSKSLNTWSLPSAADTASPTLALIMIVRNEEDNLSELLPELAPCFDEIVIVDTGSRDKTAEIAGKFTDNVFHFSWIDDFSAARNFALSKCEADWILWLDADDRMRRDDIAAIRPHISKPNKAYLLKVVSSAGDSDTAEFIQIRLFPNIEGVEWEGRIHEQLLPSLKRKGLDFELLPDATVIHKGYDDANMLRQKTRRNIHLLEKERDLRPDDPNVLHHLAQAYAIVGEFMQAIETSESFIRVLHEHPKSEFMTSAINRLIQCYLFKGNVERARAWGGRLLEMDPQNRLARYFMGEIRYRMGLFEEAADWFRQFCTTKETVGLVPVPWAALNANAHNYLGLVYERTGQREKARAEFRTAIELGARVEAYKNLALLCLEDGDSAAAETTLRAAIEHGHKNADIWTNLGVALARLQRYDEAAASFRKALEIDPADKAARENLKRLEHKLRCDLSLNMIVRDEEKNLREALASIANLFDEIVIVDTGSQDSTIAVAEELGARVIHHPWTDNFAEARNAALKNSSGKWVFWLDADDRIEPQAVRTLRKFIAREIPCGVFFPLESTIGNNGQSVQNYTLRMFPNTPEVSWKGAVHEQIADSLRDCGIDLVNCPDLTIRHVGYENEADALKKNLRNLNLLAKELASRPDDPYVVFALAQAFLFFGQEQHAVKWLQLLWKVREEKGDSSARDIFWMAALMLSDCAARSGSVAEVETWLERAIELSPSTWVAYFLLGERKLLEGQTERASDLLRKAEKIGITPTLVPLDINTIREKLERYLEELRQAPIGNHV